MLVLSRRCNEAIILTLPDGTRVKVLIVDIRNGNIVRVGIDAPSDVLILRDELQAEVDAKGGER